VNTALVESQMAEKAKKAKQNCSVMFVSQQFQITRHLCLIITSRTKEVKRNKRVPMGETVH